ncbi:hypothetical protein [Larkinella arboricola]
MKIKIMPGTSVVVATQRFGNGIEANILRYPKRYAIVSGWFGTANYREVPIREGTYKRLCKQHRARQNEKPWKLHNYVTIKL